MKEGSINTSKARKMINYVLSLILIVWTLLVLGLSYISYQTMHGNALVAAKSAAINTFRKDLVYRKWASIHGGVYVPVTEHTPPNPYLAGVPERDVETTSGKKLTLVNPAYMTRQVHELGMNEYGWQGHITSLNPIRPQNAPDDWEHKALTNFNDGVTDYSSLEMLGDEKYLRYMAPMKVEASCLKCHAHQGYKVGDVRGGISVSVPWREFESSIRSGTNNILAMYGAIWFLGVIGNFGARKLINAQLAKQELTMEALADSERMLKTVLEAAPVGIGLVKDRIVQWSNDTLSEITGYSKKEICLKPSKKFYQNENFFEKAGTTVYTEIAEKGSATVETRFTLKDGRVADFLMKLAALDKADLSAGSVFACMDISESKRIARELRESLERMQRAEFAARFGNWELDTTTETLNLSPGARTIIGVQKSQITFSELVEIALPEYGDQLREGLKELIDSQENYDIEFKVVRQSDRQVAYLHSIAKYDDESKIVWGVVQDVTSRKKAEEALVESEAKYRVLAENMKDCIWSSNSNFEFTYLSPSIETLLGYHPEEMLGKTFIEFLTPELKQKVQLRLAKRIDWFKKEKTVSGAIYEYEMLKKDGTRVWIEILVNSNSDIDGNLYGFQGVARDVTERKKAEEALRENELMFRSYVEASPIGIFETDLEGRVVSSNSANTAITGYSQDDLFKMNIKDIVVPGHLQSFAEALETLKTQGQFEAEIELTTSNGNIIWGLVNGVKLSFGRVLFFLRDISKRKEIEKDLREAVNETLQLIKSMISGFVIYESVFDENGNFITCRFAFANDAFDAITGLEGADVIGKTVHEVWPGVEQSWLDVFSEVVNTGVAKSFEMFHAPSNKLYYCNVYRPWDSKNRFCVIFENITEQKRAQEERMEMERRLLKSQKLESLGVLSGGIAHDFNNLLAVIMGNIELAQKKDVDPPEKETFLERAMQASVKSASLIRKMLDYSGKGAFELEHINLFELIQKNSEMFRMTVPKNLNLKIESDSQNIPIKADVNQIEQVIMNLLINASEAFEGKSGVIEISTGVRYCDETILSKSLLPEKPQAQYMAFLRVMDNGIGMDKDTVNRIFDPFFSTKFTGRGLGMSVVHGIVRGYNGALTIDSKIGKGTSIDVYLPLRHQTEVIEEKSGAQEHEESSTREYISDDQKIFALVVDDEPEVLELTVRQLQRFGCETFSAMNGRQALEVFKSNPHINIVILDLVMPEMGGEETFHKLMEINPELKIALCSGYNEEQLKEQLRTKLKPIAFLSKPYRISTIKNLIDRLRN